MPTRLEEISGRYVYSSIAATQAAITWRGGRGTFRVKATWGGGTVKLEMLEPDDATWVAVGTDTTLTADGGGNFELPADTQLRVNVATATAVCAAIAPAAAR